MGINEFFEAIAKEVERFTEEVAEERLLEKDPRTGRGPKVKPEKTEEKGLEEK